MSEIISMGGYGFYVWGAYAVTLVVIAAEVVAVRTRQRKAVAMAAIASSSKATR